LPTMMVVFPDFAAAARRTRPCAGHSPVTLYCSVSSGWVRNSVRLMASRGWASPALWVARRSLASSLMRSSANLRWTAESYGLMSWVSSVGGSMVSRALGSSSRSLMVWPASRWSVRSDPRCRGAGPTMREYSDAYGLIASSTCRAWWSPAGSRSATILTTRPVSIDRSGSGPAAPPALERARSPSWCARSASFSPSTQRTGCPGLSASCSLP
jgi:hypothetical protein